MGTSQSINAGVSGEPNWGKTSSAASNLANAIKKENESPDLKNNRKFQDRKISNKKTLLQNYINAAGGSHSMSSGNSSKGGKAAKRTAVLLGGSLNNISQIGFEAHLAQKGINNFSSKSKEDIIHFLLEDICDPSSNFDDSAAKSALDELFEKIFESTDETTEMSEMIEQYLIENNIDSIIVEYYGTYIFDHLFQPIQEKLSDLKGEEICNDTMNEVKDHIQAELEYLKANTELEVINWANNQEIENLMSDIFSNVINVFGDE